MRKLCLVMFSNVVILIHLENMLVELKNQVAYMKSAKEFIILERILPNLVFIVHSGVCSLCVYKSIKKERSASCFKTTS